MSEKKSEKWARTSLALDPQIKDDIDTFAHIRGVKFNAIVNSILAEYVKNNRDTLNEYKQFLSKLNDKAGVEVG